MFYYPEVLRRHTGCFGTIWLAATAQSRLLRREYLGVDVPWTCSAVTSFLIGRGGWQAPPPPAGAPPPRCSLYLGALLQLGLARVYRRQCSLLLEETSMILERLHRAQRPLVAIDLSPPKRPQLLSDCRALMEELDFAPQPFFGLMEIQEPQLLSSSFGLMEINIPQVEELLPILEAPAEVSAEQIRLRESEEIQPAEAMGVELPEVTSRDLELLMEVEEFAAELELPLPPRQEIRENLGPSPPLPLPPREFHPQIPQKIPKILPKVPQIPAEKIQQQLGEPWGECERRDFVSPPHLRRKTPNELLSSSAHDLIPREFWELWDRSFQLLPPKAEAPPSELEVLREALEPSLPPVSSEFSLEPMEEEPSVPPLPAPPPEVLPEVPEAPSVDLRRLLLGHAHWPEGAELAAILGVASPRSRAARAFALCLELCASGWLSLEQPKPYGPIRIKLRPGRQ